MKNRKKLVLLSFAAAVALAGAALAGAMSPFAKSTISAAAFVPEQRPVQANCNVVTVTNVSSQSVAAGQGEKITVDWSFNGTDCLKADGFEVWIEVTRRSGRTNTRKIDASGTARSVTATFTEAGVGNLSDEITSAKAVVTAKLSNAKDDKTQPL
jgi:hypothetical protein